MTQSVEIFQSEDGKVSLEVRTDGETVWLSRAQLAELFARDGQVPLGGVLSVPDFLVG
jgi:hypothetical protein